MAAQLQAQALHLIGRPLHELLAHFRRAGKTDLPTDGILQELVGDFLGWAPYPWSLVNPDALPFEELLSLADRALYLAKREGRNRAVGVLPGPDNAAGEPVPEGSLKAVEGRLVELVRQPGPDVVPSFAPASPDSSQIRATRAR